MTLLKQGRAFGLGVVLATQNPVDLDYKGLANTGTWFLGRLQTERDKARMLDGLEGAAAGSMDRAETDRLLSALDKRVFLLHNVHDKAPVVFQTRWTLSYLRGPPLQRPDSRADARGGGPARRRSQPGSGRRGKDVSGHRRTADGRRHGTDVARRSCRRASSSSSFRPPHRPARFDTRRSSLARRASRSATPSSASTRSATLSTPPRSGPARWPSTGRRRPRWT